MALDPTSLDDSILEFLGERHLATLTTLRADGSPHVVPVGFGYDASDQTVRVISFAGSQKVVNAMRGGRAAPSSSAIALGACQIIDRAEKRSGRGRRGLT